MGLAFIDRTIRTTALVGCIFFPFLLVYTGFWSALSWLSGLVWGGMNLMLLTSLIVKSLRPEGADREKTAIFGFLKFPVLYAAGFALLSISAFSAPWLLIGSAMPLLMLLLKALGLVSLQRNVEKSTGSVSESQPGAHFA